MLISPHAYFHTPKSDVDRPLCRPPSAPARPRRRALAPNSACSAALVLIRTALSARLTLIRTALHARLAFTRTPALNSVYSATLTLSRAALVALALISAMLLPLAMTHTHGAAPPAPVAAAVATLRARECEHERGRDRDPMRAPPVNDWRRLRRANSPGFDDG